MDSGTRSSLVHFFIEKTVQPVTQILKSKNTLHDQDIQVALQQKMTLLTETFIEAINSAYGLNDEDKEVKQLVDHLLDKIDEDELHDKNFISSEYSDNFESQETENNVLIISNIIEPIEVVVPQSNDDISSTDKAAIPKASEDDYSTVSASSPVSSDFSTEMPSRKKVKRSLEDTVQMLSDDIKKSKESSVSPNPPAAQSVPFILPHVPLPFSNPVMQRWMASPFYINTIFQQPKPSEEQLAALMKISMQAANFIKFAGASQTPCQNDLNDSDAEDIKIDVESDEGDTEVSPSPSNNDMMEIESPSSAQQPSPVFDGENAAEKPFVCMHNNCGKRFANKFLLKKHMFIHTGLRPHTCPHCHKKFNRKDNLLRHKKTHLPSGGQTAQMLPKVNFSLQQIPGLHNVPLTGGFNHFHALKMSLEAGTTAVRSS